MKSLGVAYDPPPRPIRALLRSLAHPLCMFYYFLTFGCLIEYIFKF